MRGEIEKWQTKKKGEKVEMIKPDNAATEDLEYKKFEEKYIDAKYNLEEFINYAKNRDLEENEKEAVKNLEERLARLRELLENKNYKEFKEAQDKFNDQLEDLYYKNKEIPYEKDEAVEKLAAAMGLSEEEKPELASLSPEQAPVAPVPPSPAETKKSLWGKLKERGKKITGAIFNRETGKIAGKVSYDTITSILGIKLITDIMQGWTGKGDLAEWWKGRRESKASREAIAEAYQRLMQSFKKVKRNETLVESEKIEIRLIEFKIQVESARISPEEKKALLDRLLAIGEKHREDTETAVKERDEEARRVLDAYLQAKISGMKIAKDALNFALTATGFSMLRGLAYAGASIAERVGKARKEYIKRNLDVNSKKTEFGFVAKDVFVNSAIETARALSLRGEKKGANKKTKTIDFIKALGTVARGFGIYGLAISGTDSTEQSIDKLINSIKEQGVTGMVSDNFIQNAERAWYLYTHPTEVFKRHKGSTALKPEEHHEVLTPPEHPPAAEHHEAPVSIEPVEHGDHTVAVEVLNNREGILNGVNKIIHNHSDIFTHADGKPWTAAEIHAWKTQELKDMGFKFKGDKWGYPMTVHGGAKVEVFTDEQGQPHFKLASDEHVTFNKNYKWVDTEAVERATMPKPARVDLDIKEKAIVHHAPAAAPAHPAGGPEAAEVKETVSQFLTERGSNPKEFVWVYDKMVDSAIDQVKDKLIFQGNAAEFLQGKINALYNARMTPENITSFNPSDSRSLAMVEKILDAENKFKLNQSDWLKSFSQTMFDKSDKAMRLALAPDRDVLLEPIKTNGGHAARIWDPAEGKDVFIYDKDRVFNTNDDGRLIVKDEYGVTRLFSQKQALKMAEKP